MREYFYAGGVVVLLAAAFGQPGSTLSAQNVLPDAPGQDVAVKVCAGCHAADAVEARKERLACI